MDLGSFAALTFDCYGTLIDWERGLLTALPAVLGPRAVRACGEDALLERFAALEAEAERGPYRSYGVVLSEVARELGREMGIRVSDARARAFAASVGDWPAFPDTVPALRALQSRYRLAIVSNVDDDLFAASAERLEVTFEHVVTAQQVRSYKPSPGHFREVVARLALPAERVLHVAQSLYHDVRPARAYGLRCVWVNRRRGRPGHGATPAAAATADLEVPDLWSLALKMGLR